MADTEKPIGVLYVCPRAHRAGHAPLAVVRESEALARAGARVCVLTFEGILCQSETGTLRQEQVVATGGRLGRGIACRWLGAMPGGRHLVWFLEQFVTIVAAARRSKSSGYDVIYLRDGDPFVFIPFLLGSVTRGHRWAISLVGVVGKRTFGSMPNRVIGARIWKSVYRRAMSRNRFILVCENEYVRQYYEAEFMQGVFSGRVAVLPAKAERAASYVSKEEARGHLGLPQDKPVLLHFGAIHAGKDVETVLKGIRDVPGAGFVHAGEVTSGADPGRLAERYALGDRVTVMNRYVPEEEKHYFFCAADAIALSYKADFLQTASMLWEAARFGVPAIASDVGELGELVRRHGIGVVFEAEDARSFATSLSRFLALEDEAREAMRVNCRRFRDEYSTDDWGLTCLRILERLCAE